MSQNDGEPTPSAPPWLPPRWVIRAAWWIHRRLHRITRGRFGLRQPRADRYGLAQLSVTGRRTGLERSVMIGYYRDGDDFVTMAMNGWDAAEPVWWLNLQADPNATLTLTDISIAVIGRAAHGDEHTRLWDRWRHFDQNLDGYASRRPGGTAVVVLSPSSASRRVPDPE